MHIQISVRPGLTLRMHPCCQPGAGQAPRGTPLLDSWQPNTPLVQDLYPESYTRKITEKWLREGDLLINSTGVGSLGRTAQVWFKPEKLTVDSHITIVRTRKPEHALYLGFWAFAHERYVESLHTGSTEQTELPRDHVKAIRFVLPDAATLNWFNSIAGPVVKTMVANQDENKKLGTLRDALLPKLMSGEIDVSQIELPT